MIKIKTLVTSLFSLVLTILFLTLTINNLTYLKDTYQSIDNVSYNFTTQFIITALFFFILALLTITVLVVGFSTMKQEYKVYTKVNKIKYLESIIENNKFEITRKRINDNKDPKEQEDIKNKYALDLVINKIKANKQEVEKNDSKVLDIDAKLADMFSNSFTKKVE